MSYEDAHMYRLASAYWCNSLMSDSSDRFYWAWEEVDDAVRVVGPKARSILMMLILTVPNDRLAAYFAAGPLEDYINQIIETENKTEAQWLSGLQDIDDLLPMVWGGIDKFEAMKGDGTVDTLIHADAGMPLSTLSPKDAISYWCYAVSGNRDFTNSYERVVELLKSDHATMAKQDLHLTSPDDAAYELLCRDQEGE